MSSLEVNGPKVLIAFQKLLHDAAVDAMNNAQSVLELLKRNEHTAYDQSKW